MATIYLTRVISIVAQLMHFNSMRAKKRSLLDECVRVMITSPIQPGPPHFSLQIEFSKTTNAVSAVYSNSASMQYPLANFEAADNRYYGTSPYFDNLGLSFVAPVIPGYNCTASVCVYNLYYSAPNYNFDYSTNGSQIVIGSIEVILLIGGTGSCVISSMSTSPTAVLTASPLLASSAPSHLPSKFPSNSTKQPSVRPFALPPSTATLQPSTSLSSNLICNRVILSSASGSPPFSIQIQYLAITSNVAAVYSNNASVQYPLSNFESANNKYYGTSPYFDNLGLSFIAPAIAGYNCSASSCVYNIYYSASTYYCEYASVNSDIATALIAVILNIEESCSISLHSELPSSKPILTPSIFPSTRYTSLRPSPSPINNETCAKVVISSTTSPPFSILVYSFSNSISAVYSDDAKTNFPLSNFLSADNKLLKTPPYVDNLGLSFYAPVAEGYNCSLTDSRCYYNVYFDQSYALDFASNSSINKIYSALVQVTVELACNMITPSTIPSNAPNSNPSTSPRTIMSITPSFLPSITASTRPSTSPSTATVKPTTSDKPPSPPTATPSPGQFTIPADIPLPFITSSTIGSIYASSPIAPSVSVYAMSSEQSNHYLNSTAFSSTYYDFGPSVTTSSVLTMGGLTVATLSGYFVPAPCSALKVIIKTPYVYVDDFTVAATYSATDTIGRLQCSYTSVKMTINNGTKVMHIGTCRQSSNPVGTCTFSGTGTSIFSGEVFSAVVTMTTSSSTISSSASVIFNAQRTQISVYESLRGYISLPQSTLYPGDEFTVSLTIFSNSTASSIGSCAIILNYNASYLSYVVNSAVSNLFLPVTDEGIGYIHIVFGATNKVTDTTGTGLVNVGALKFSVLSAVKRTVTSQITGQMLSIGGVHGTSFCESKYAGQLCSSQNVFYGKYFSGSTDDLLFLDMVGAPGHTPGNVAIISPVVIGLYATSGSSVLVNTVELTGTAATDTLTVYATYGTPRSSWPDVAILGTNLLCSTTPGDVLFVAPNTYGLGCAIQAISGGASAYAVKAVYSSFTIFGTYRVYYPRNFTVVATRRVLRKLSNCPTFQTASLRTLATFYLNDTHFVSNVDVTSLISLDSTDHSVATYSSKTNTVSGVGSYSEPYSRFHVIAVGSSSGITLGNSTFYVSSQLGYIKGFYVYSYSTVKAKLSSTTFLELEPLEVSIYVSLPELSGQTSFRSGVPQSNYAKLVTYAQDNDGYFTDVSQYSGLHIVSLDPSNVNVTTSGVGPNTFWYAYVPQNGAATNGNILVPMLYGNCGETLSSHSTKQGYIFTTSGIPYKATLQVGTTKLTKRNGCATTSPINLQFSTQLTAVLFLIDPTSTVVMTSDFRTQYSVTATPGVNISVTKSGQLLVGSNSKVGTATVMVTFPLYRGAAGINATVSVTIVDLTTVLQVITYDYPGHTVSPFSNLKQIQCTGVYQRASIDAIATLTDGSTFTVTEATTFSTTSSQSIFKLLSTSGNPYGNGPGQAIITVSTSKTAPSTKIFASFCGTYAAGNVTVASGGLVVVSSLSKLQYGPTAAQQPAGQGCVASVYTVSNLLQIGCGATSTQGCPPTSLQIHLSDNTILQYSDLPKIGLFSGALLNFNSSTPTSIVANSSTGALLARQNSYQYATIHVNAYCSSNRTVLPIHTAVANVAANLYPSDNDIKLGYPTGIPFIQCPGSKTVTIPAYFKVPVGYYIGAWDVFMYYRSADIMYSRAVYNSTGGSWTPLNPPTVSSISVDSSVGYVHLLSNAYTTISTSTEGNGALVHVVDLTFQASSALIITEITAKISGLFYNPVSSISLSAKVTVASSTTAVMCTSCVGYIDLNNGIKLDNSLAITRNRRLQSVGAHLKDVVSKRNLVSSVVLNGDVSGNGLCGIEDYIEVLTLYALPSYWTIQSLTIVEARNAALTLNYISHCHIDYCGFGNYTVPFVMSNLVVVDASASLDSYARNFPIIQFLKTQTPCDLVTQLPTSRIPTMTLQIVLYSPKVDFTGNTGIPVSCISTNISYHVDVYFEVNFPRSEITSVISGGSIQEVNLASTVIGPAACKENGVFSISFSVSTLIPASGFYAVGVGLNSTFGNSNTQKAYYNIQYPRLYSAATQFDPLYNSNNCPFFSSVEPISKPSSQPLPQSSSQPTHSAISTRLPFPKPSALPSSHIPALPIGPHVPTQSPSSRVTPAPVTNPAQPQFPITLVTASPAGLFVPSQTPTVHASASPVTPPVESHTPTTHVSISPVSLPVKFPSPTTELTSLTPVITILPSVSAPSSIPSLSPAVSPSIGPAFNIPALVSSQFTAHQLIENATVEQFTYPGANYSWEKSIQRILAGYYSPRVETVNIVKVVQNLTPASVAKTYNMDSARSQISKTDESAVKSANLDLTRLVQLDYTVLYWAQSTESLAFYYGNLTKLLMIKSVDGTLINIYNSLCDQCALGAEIISPPQFKVWQITEIPSKVPSSSQENSDASQVFISQNYDAFVSVCVLFSICLCLTCILGICAYRSRIKLRQEDFDSWRRRSDTLPSNIATDLPHDNDFESEANGNANSGLQLNVNSERKLYRNEYALQVIPASGPLSGWDSPNGQLSPLRQRQKYLVSDARKRSSLGRRSLQSQPPSDSPLRSGNTQNALGSSTNEIVTHESGGIEMTSLIAVTENEEAEISPKISTFDNSSNLFADSAGVSSFSLSPDLSHRDLTAPISQESRLSLF